MTSCNVSLCLGRHLHHHRYKHLDWTWSLQIIAIHSISLHSSPSLLPFIGVFNCSPAPGPDPYHLISQLVSDQSCGKGSEKSWWLGNNDYGHFISPLSPFLLRRKLRFMEAERTCLGSHSWLRCRARPQSQIWQLYIRCSLFYHTAVHLLGCWILIVVEFGLT